MRLLVVLRSAPNASFTLPLPTWRRMNAHPPGPGLPLQAPSVKSRTSGWSDCTKLASRSEVGSPRSEIRGERLNFFLISDLDTDSSSLRRVLDIDNVAVLNHIVLRLLPHQAGGFDLALTAESDDDGYTHRFGADEAA